jgi:HAE1 family hydrophobic/amphiphilic exporter-1
MLPISELGKIEWKDASPNILRRDKIRIKQLDGFLSKSTTGQVQKILDKEFEKINFPEGYGYKYVGMDEYFVESTREISKAFLIASILTFMLLIAILNSFTLPFVIITSILTSFLGVIYFLFFFGYSINIGSLMAIIMLVGLAVNNAILMIDNTIQEAKHTKDLREALWNGTKGKFKTIIMTSFAIILGTLPQLTDANSAKASMGAVIIGGMVASIIFTLVLVPMIFEYVVKKFKVVF